MENHSGESLTDSVRVGPIAAAERILTLDVLRGFALFGILFVNVNALVHPTSWFTVNWSELGAFDYAFEAFNILFTQGKFYTLFAFLFGLGFAVQLGRAEKKGVRFAGRFFWRLLLLWLIGVTHMIVLWDGDILNTYAVGGVFLLLFYGLKRLIDKAVRRFSKKRDKAPRGLALVMAGILIFGPLGLFAGFMTYATSIQQKAVAGIELDEGEMEVWEQIQQADDPERKAEREESQAKKLDTYKNGSYLDTVNMRIESFANRAISGPFWLMIAGIFMIGAYFGRNNFIGRAQEYRAGFRKLMWTSLIVGLPLTSGFLYVHIAGEGAPNFSWFNFLNFFFKTSAGLAFALFFVAAITLAMLTSARDWLKWFAPVGRMALSNYLLQSVIGTTVFYGYGLGLVDSVGNGFELGYMLVLFAFQIWVSTWWLERFRFGPVEWLWRSLTYWKLQPMRRDQHPVAA